MIESNETSYRYQAPASESHSGHDAHSSGVSWGAVIAGAFVAAAFYLILMALGAGFGLSSVSPWSINNSSLSALGTAAIVWLIVTEIVASALGGYLTGRLRTKWAAIHTDEVYFRDTANGFLSWAVALVIGFAVLATAAASMAGNRPSPTAENRMTYFADSLFRSDRGATDAGLLSEAERIMVHGFRSNDLTAADRSYLDRMVEARTGLNGSDADKRVSDVIAQARESEDAARKLTARFLLWSFLAFMFGAFSASYAATIGGRQRDHMKLI